MTALPTDTRLPLGIRALRDAVIVMVCIALGGAIGGLPYGAEQPDPRMVQIFQAVFGTLGFAFCGFLAKSRRSLQMTLTTLVIGLFAGLLVALGGQHAFWWAFALAALSLMALLGAGLAILIERLARD